MRNFAFHRWTSVYSSECYFSLPFRALEALKTLKRPLRLKLERWSSRDPQAGWVLFRRSMGRDAPASLGRWERRLVCLGVYKHSPDGHAEALKM